VLIRVYGNGQRTYTPATENGNYIEKIQRPRYY
jgi:hypothetical protein